MSADPMLYVIRLLNVDMSQYDEHVGPHVAWVDRHATASNFLYAGPLEERREGGVIIAQAPSREALDTILSSDPFRLNGVATHEVIPFFVTRGHNFKRDESDAAAAHQ
jgi:uncharacterized protein YciI